MLTESAGGSTRSVRGADISGEGHPQDHAEGAETP